MTAPWIAQFLALAELSTGTLRASLATLTMLAVLPKQREAIAHELAMRAWAEAVEAGLSTTIAWCRGGRS